MTVCQFFLQGRCRFGTECRNQHPGEQTAFNDSTNTSNTTTPTTLPALFTIETMTKDLNAGQDRPLWPLSSYGPAKHEPVLISGLDESPEELRVRAAQAIASGKLAEYQTYETNQMQKAEAAINSAKSNITQAHDQAIKQSPLLQQMNNGNTTGSAFGKSAFGAFGAPATTPAFGQSAFGSTPAPTSAFGSTPAPAPASALGSTSAPTSAFGANISTTKPPTGSAFGQSAFGATPPFYQSAFGSSSAPSFGQSSFGSTNAPANSAIKPATGGFGAFASGGPSAFATAAASAPATGGFGAFAGKSSAFGTGAPTTGGSVFGQSAFGSGSGSAFGGGGSGSGSAFGGGGGGGGNAFGTGGNALEPRPPPAFGTFGGNAPAAPATSAFGQSGTAQPTNSAFGQSAPAPTSAFGTQPASTASAFGAQPTTSAFGTSNMTSAFGQPAATSAFGQSAFGQSASAFGSSNTPSPFGSSSFSSASAPTKPQQPGAPPFAALKAGPSPYKPHSGLNPYDGKLAGGNYSQMLPTVVLEAFKKEKYEWGKVPEWAPPLEMR